MLVCALGHPRTERMSECAQGVDRTSFEVGASPGRGRICRRGVTPALQDAKRKRVQGGSPGGVRGRAPRRKFWRLTSIFYFYAFLSHWVRDVPSKLPGGLASAENTQCADTMHHAANRRAPRSTARTAHPAINQQPPRRCAAATSPPLSPVVLKTAWRTQALTSAHTCSDCTDSSSAGARQVQRSSTARRRRRKFSLCLVMLVNPGALGLGTPEPWHSKAITCARERKRVSMGGPAVGQEVAAPKGRFARSEDF